MVYLINSRRVQWVKIRYKQKKVGSQNSFHSYKLFTVMTSKAARIMNSFINGIVKRIGDTRQRIPRSRKKKGRRYKESSTMYKVFTGFSTIALSIMNRFVNDIYESIAKEASQLSRYVMQESINEHKSRNSSSCSLCC